MDAATQEAPRQEIGLFGRIIGVFTAPGKTFESIARKPAWVVPVILVLAWTVVATLIITPRLDPEPIIQKQVKAAEKQLGREMTQDEIAKRRTAMEFFFKISPVIATCFVAILIFMVPAIYHGLAAAWGKAGGYIKTLSVYAHAQFIQVLKGMLLTAIAATRQKIDPEQMGTLLKSNLGAFLDPANSNAVIRTILTNIDVFDIWGLVVCTIGLSKVTKLGTKGAAIVVFGVWAVYVLVSAGFAGIGAAMGG